MSRGRLGRSGHFSDMWLFLQNGDAAEILTVRAVTLRAELCLVFTYNWKRALTPHYIGHLTGLGAHFNPQTPQRIVGKGRGASRPGISSGRRVLVISPPAVILPGVYFAIALFHCLAPNESRGL